MKIIHINSGNTGSIGKIIKDINSGLKKKGIECGGVFAYTYNDNTPNYYQIASRYENKINRWMSCFTGYCNCFAKHATRKLIAYLEKEKPDIIHLHNLHGDYINIHQMFSYLSQVGIPVVWTLHDCWAFTGKCPYFDQSGCQKWRTECGDCPVYRQYPRAKFDRSKYLFHLKKQAFTSVKKLQLVTPSQWLANCVKESFLKDVPVKVIHNGINLNIFQPQDNNLRERYHIGDRQIILGVAAPFDGRKGVHIFERLARELPFDEYVVVMIGLDETQMQTMPDNIIKIQRTNNQQELAAWYTVADVFLNATYEDNFPTTNIEALACGTPVITFKTGGSPESINELTGIVVEKDDYDTLYDALVLKRYKVFKSDNCIERARVFTKEKMSEEYVNLYSLL